MREVLFNDGSWALRLRAAVAVGWWFLGFLWERAVVHALGMLPGLALDLTLPWPSGAQYVAEAEEKLQRARLLVDSVRKEKVDLSNQLEEERRCVQSCGPWSSRLPSGWQVPSLLVVGKTHKMTSWA